MTQPKLFSLEYILIHYRWVFVCLFLLPVSFFYDIWFYFRNWIVFRLNSAPQQHHLKVQHVQKQVKEWIKSGKKVPMCTSRPGWQTICFRRPLYKKYFYNIDVKLVDVLEVNTKKKTVKVEPLVTMGQLSATLNPLGWTIPVLPEMDDLTIGGAVMGTGVESTSHRHGLLQHSCVSYELVLNDGSVVTCSKDEKPDLYYSVPWSYGTVGILTSVEIKIVPAKKYVKLEYHPFKKIDVFVEKFTQASKAKKEEFVEGIVFSENEGVLMTGNQTDEADEDKINEIGRWYKPWFYIHVRNKLRDNQRRIEYIPLREYYHRHTRSIFWELQDIIPFGNNVLFRYLLGWLVPPKVSLLKLTQTEAVKKLYENNHVFQDILVPISTLKESIQLFHKVFQVYPLWLCPFNLPANPGFVHPASSTEEMYVDIGVYGVPKVKVFHPVENTRKIEEYVRRVNGFQMLYADTYATREEFREMFDHSLYDRVRKELDCKDAFPDVYDKVCKSARY